MNKQFTRDEMVRLLGLLQLDRNDRGIHIVPPEMAESIDSKLVAGIEACAKQEALARVQPERFVSVISQEDAEQYNSIGQRAMYAAGRLRLPEGQHAKLCYIMIGLTSGLCQALNLPRERFCADSVSNVMFVALKAAYAVADGPTLDASDATAT